MKAEREHTGLRFRRAQIKDTKRAQAAYGQIIEHLAATVDFPHWHSENHPTPQAAQDWIRAGHLYLAVASTKGPASQAEQIAGVVVLNHEAPEAYKNAPWAIEATEREVLVVHALGVVPEFLGKGVAKFLVDSAIQVAKDKGCLTVRLDTYIENLPARQLYSRHGFTDLGAFSVQYEGTSLDQFHLFERVL